MFEINIIAQLRVNLDKDFLLKDICKKAVVHGQLICSNLICSPSQHLSNIQHLTEYVLDYKRFKAALPT